MHSSRDQLVAVIQGDLGLGFTGGIKGQELFDITTTRGVHCPGVTELHVTYNICWLAPCSLIRVAWIYMYFSMFAPTVRLGTQSCKPYIQQYPMLGYKTEHKLLDIGLRLDMMSADEVT
ncbi:hypothetical protein M9H77_08967 [Catharanthus roseus]|uniref:Uncharacterized protein n=1 Tax=Catharanthus roseus TaxID=4058 RepID=A0ACC0BZH0_CATRO|nr:hypothetical protein M9H77_08967 [Catharanthus roseus]